jgi:hypothetical protein
VVVHGELIAIVSGAQHVLAHSLSKDPSPLFCRHKAGNCEVTPPCNPHVVLRADCNVFLVESYCDPQVGMMGSSHRPKQLSQFPKIVNIQCGKPRFTIVACKL